MTKNLRFFLASVLVLTITGCGSGPSEEEVQQQRSAMELFDEGIQAFEQRDYAKAKESLLSATENGTLRGDFQEAAMVKLALAQTASGDANAGLNTLNTLESNSSYFEDRTGFLAAKSYVLQKQGNRSAASQAWREARSLNPRVRRFKE